MNDIQIKTHIAQSEANGFYQQMNEMKKQREKIKVSQDNLEGKLLAHVQQMGKVLAYKDDVPYILSSGIRTTTKLDKAALASDLGVTQSELTTIRMAELVEAGKLSAQMIQSHMYEEKEPKLKARKATNKDFELIFGK